MEEGAIGFCFVDGSVESGHTGYSGRGYANTTNRSGSAIVWRVDARLRANRGLAQLAERFDTGPAGLTAVECDASGGVIHMAPTGRPSNPSNRPGR